MFCIEFIPYKKEEVLISFRYFDLDETSIYVEKIDINLFSIQTSKRKQLSYNEIVHHQKN